MASLRAAVATTAATTNPTVASRNYLQASLDVARVELALAQQKVNQIQQWIAFPGSSDAMAAEAASRINHASGTQDNAAEITSPKKKRKLVQYDEDGKVIKKAMSGYNLYMTEMMKPVDGDGNKPKFGDVASGWKNLSEDEKAEWTNKAKAAVPKVAREEWVEVVDKKKRDKSGYNVYVSTLMKETDKDGNKKNIQEIAATWKELPDEEKEKWNEKASKEAEESAAEALAKEEEKAAKKKAKEEEKAAKKKAKEDEKAEKKQAAAAAKKKAKEEEKAEKKKAAAAAKAAKKEEEKAEKKSKKMEESDKKKKKEEKGKKTVSEKKTPAKKTPSKAKHDLVATMKKKYINSRVAAFVEADKDDPDDEDVWLPGDIKKVFRDEDDDTIVVEIQTVDRQTGEVEFPKTQDSFPTDDCRLLSERGGVTYLHDPKDHKKKVEFYRECPKTLKKNDTVYGSWGKKAWYRGHITSVDDKKPRRPVTIEFDDGDKKAFYADKNGYSKVWLVNTKAIKKIKPKKIRK